MRRILTERGHPQGLDLRASRYRDRLHASIAASIEARMRGANAAVRQSRLLHDGNDFLEAHQMVHKWGC